MADVTLEQIDDLQLQVEELLLTEMSQEGLVKLAQELRLEETKWKDVRKLKLISTIRNDIDKEMDGFDSIPEKKDGLIKIMKFVTEIINNGTADENMTADGNVTADGKVNADGNVKTETANSEQVLQARLRTENLFGESLGRFRKDFVINGKVGEKDSEKDVGYLGIVRQMKEGAEKGYSDTEIVAAVLRVIIPKSLKTYLGVITDLNTTKLAQILRIHYQEKSATELYQELITMRQNSNEEAIAFVIRAFETREKILVASKEEGEVPYDKMQVQKICVSTIESGINKDIAVIIRPYLTQARMMNDVEIMNEVHRAEGSL